MKLSSFKRTAMAGAAALTVVGASLGVAAAQQAPDATPAPAASPAPGQRGGGPQGLHQQRQDHRDQLLKAVAAKLNVSPDQLRQAFTDARKDLGLPDGPRGFEGHGPGRRGGPGGPAGLNAAASAIGISADQLRQELPGKSLADVARAHNVDPSTVANALKQDANARIDQAVSAGRLTSDQATQAKQRVSDRIDQMMNGQMPSGQPGHGNKPDRGGRSGGR
ncbi:MAG: hypothetical protein IT305_13885 [Chloroflexi bacterium]|nr:hypothetical protein [Chloroflexota bacterium]